MSEQCEWKKATVKHMRPDKKTGKLKEQEVDAGYFCTTHKLFLKYIDGDWHIMVKEGNAIGIDHDEVYTKLQEYGCEDVVVVNGAVAYLSKFSQWATGTCNEYGHGFQQFLPIDRMKHVKKDEIGHPLV